MGAFADKRRRMVEDQIAARGIVDHAVRQAMGAVPRELDWDAPVEIMDVRPAHRESYERLCHDAAVPAFLLPLRYPIREAVREELRVPRLERAIGVIYRPESERSSHYFEASLPGQFDEYVWFDRTSAVIPLGQRQTAGMPETYPFGL